MRNLINISLPSWLANSTKMRHWGFQFSIVMTIASNIKREIFQMISCLRWSQTIRSAANNTTDNFSHNKIYNCWAVSCEWWVQLWNGLLQMHVEPTSIAYHCLIHEKWKGKTSHLLLFNSSSQEWVSNSMELFQLLNRWKFPAPWNTISWFSEYFFLQFAP